MQPEPKTIVSESVANVHCHLREGPEIGPLIERAIEGGADVLLPMPNTNEGLTTYEKVRDYIFEAKKLVPHWATMRFIPTAMITEETKTEEIVRCANNNVLDFKVYPRDRTTKSHNGVIRYSRILNTIKDAAAFVRATSNKRIRIHFHPEHPSMQFGNRDAEFAFLAIAYSFIQETDAIIVWEHGTDARCIPHWKELAQSGRFWVTLTAHHLVANEDNTFGDVRSVCKPPIKTEFDRLGLIGLISEGHVWVMAGADDAPHPVDKKHVHQGTCACGAYTSEFLLQLYAHSLDSLFDVSGGVQIFNAFVSRNARSLYGLPDASRQIMLEKRPWKVPYSYDIGSWKVEPFWAGRELNWSLFH